MLAEVVLTVMQMQLIQIWRKSFQIIYDNEVPNLV